MWFRVGGPPRVRAAAPFPARMWLPLYALEKLGKVYSKTKLQKLVFLAQYEARLDLYDFRKFPYGPYSPELNFETLMYPSLIRTAINTSSLDPQRQYYLFELGPEGGKVLSKLSAKVGKAHLVKVGETLERYSKVKTPELLEEVYRRFALKDEDSAKLEAGVIRELEPIMSANDQYFRTHGGRQAFFLLLQLRLIERSIGALGKTVDTVQRGVILNLAQETIAGTREALGDMASGADSSMLRPKFVDLGDLTRYLREYCDARGIIRDSLKQPLKELMSEDEAKRLAKALAEVELPA